MYLLSSVTSQNSNVSLIFCPTTAVGHYHSTFVPCMVYWIPLLKRNGLKSRNTLSGDSMLWLRYRHLVPSCTSVVLCALNLNTEELSQLTPFPYLPWQRPSLYGHFLWLRLPLQLLWPSANKKYNMLFNIISKKIPDFYFTVLISSSFGMNTWLIISSMRP